MKFLKLNLILASCLCLIPFGFVIVQIETNNLLNFGERSEALMHQQDIASSLYIVTTSLVALILLIISLILARKHKMKIIGQITGIIGSLTILPFAFLPRAIDDPWGALIGFSSMIPINLLIVTIIFLFIFCRYKSE